jgi:hypothetical protein
MSALPLTDWIPCTTPPVRDGEYELTMFPNDSETSAIRETYQAGAWFGCPGVNEEPGDFYWRGVRRWVLTVPSLCCAGGERDYVAGVSRRGVVYTNADLYHPRMSAAHTPMDFATEAAAVAYATKHARHLNGWKAVLP